MNKIGFIPNQERDLHLDTTKELIRTASGYGGTVYMNQSFIDALDGEEVVFVPDVYENVDFVVILGGDGTILHSVKHAAPHNIPVIGINLGNLGYLTDVEKSGAREALLNVLQGKYKLEKRMMLDAYVSQNGSPFIQMGGALNEVCISRSAGVKLVDIEIYVNNEYIDTYRCDGIILSTPTGSTAYNLSAGGPILKPDSQMMALTLICPHTLYARPFVFSSDDVVTVKTRLNEKDTAFVCLDGHQDLTVSGRSEIQIKRSNFCASILKTNDLGFYDILRLKMVGEMKQ